MRTSAAEIRSRREGLAGLLRREGYLSVGELSNRFSVSEATIRRDLRILEQEKRVMRTYGGALSEYDELFIPFSQRNVQNRVSKQRIARAAVRHLHAGSTVFLDAGSTVFHITEEFVRHDIAPIRFVTNNLPAAEKLAKESAAEIHLLGGQLLPHQLIVVGPGAGLSLSPWRFDIAYLSAEGMNSEGLWNSRDAISEFQRHVCGRTRQAIFCIDESKLNRTAPSYLMSWQEVRHLITSAARRTLESFNINLNGATLECV